MALFEAQGQAIRQTNTKLAFHIKEGSLQVVAMADNVVNDNASVCAVIDGNAAGARKRLLLAIDIVDEVDECHRLIHWTKGHHCVRPFDRRRALKSKFLLAGKRIGQLMVAQWGIVQPHPQSLPNSLDTAKSQQGIRYAMI